MRRTRIVATIGPASQDDAMLSALLSAGVNVCRLNYSHGEPEQKTELYSRIRSMEQELGRPTCILADLPGPKLRLGEFDGVHVLTMGNEVTLHCGVANMADASAHKLPVQYDGLSQELQPGDPVLLSDGLIRLSVISATGQRSGTVVCRVEDGGPISSRKGINVPGTLVDLPAIGPKDELALEHALDTGADLIAVSYVRTPEDMQPAKDAIKARGLSTWLVAKIEHPMALKQLDAILDVADAVMVARGDLGVEIPLEEVPIAQQRIIDGALERGMPVIVATQMLETMTVNPRPTRAEVSDISTAIRQGATGVMLSGETSIGKYPIQCIKMLKKIASKTEHFRTLGYEKFLQNNSDWQNIAKGARDLAERINADGIIVITRSGQTANVVSNTKPFRMPVYAFTNSRNTFLHLSLIGGMKPYFIKSITNQSLTIEKMKTILLASQKSKKSLKFVLIAGIYSASHTDSIQIIAT